MNVNDIIIEHTALIKHIVAQFNPPNEDVREQLIAAGYTGLWKAIMAFDPITYKTQLTTIALPSIRWEIMTVLNELNSNTISLQNIAEPYYYPRQEIWEYLPDHLTISEKELIYLRLDQHTLKEIAVLFGVSHITVKRMLKKLINKLRRANGTK
jgi:RNA polymerase sigma factor (sigma-70 family)